MATNLAGFKDPVRNINRAFLVGLEIESHKIFPLPGATGRRQSNEVDSRLSKIAGTTPVGEDVTYYEHLATVRHRPTNTFYVVFRETMDAFLVRHSLCTCKNPAFNAKGQCGQCHKSNASMYPEWLMKAPEKQAELMINIYAVKCHPNTVAVMRSHEDWLSHIADTTIFDALAFFLEQKGIVDQKALANLR